MRRDGNHGGGSSAHRHDQACVDALAFEYGGLLGLRPFSRRRKHSATGDQPDPPFPELVLKPPFDRCANLKWGVRDEKDDSLGLVPFLVWVREALTVRRSERVRRNRGDERDAQRDTDSRSIVHGPTSGLTNVSALAGVSPGPSPFRHEVSRCRRDRGSTRRTPRSSTRNRTNDSTRATEIAGDVAAVRLRPIASPPRLWSDHTVFMQAADRRGWHDPGDSVYDRVS